VSAGNLRAVLAADYELGAGNVLLRLAEHGADMDMPRVTFDTEVDAIAAWTPLSLRTLTERVAARAEWLRRHGIGRRDPVAVYVTSAADLFLNFFALTWLGAIPALMNGGMPAEIAAEYIRRDGRLPQDALFFAEQNARLVQNAEHYYRAMFGGHVLSWNLRDTHMAETLDALTSFLARGGTPPKLVVWAHNSHLGDARATELGSRGELNVGQLVRTRHGADAALIGFTTYAGTVTAASDWDGHAERKVVRPALPESYEALFHDVGGRNFLLDLRTDRELRSALLTQRLERAIGVIYRPETERMSHYFAAKLSSQFDAVLHYDVTRAVEPLERTGVWDRGEIPETYPSAL